MCWPNQIIWLNLAPIKNLVDVTKVVQPNDIGCAN